MTSPHRITIKDIAREAGVSTAAVSQALRPQSKSNIKLHADTIERVRSVALKLNYQAHSGARSIRSNSFNTIGYFAARTGLMTNSPGGYLAGVHDISESHRSRVTLIRLQVAGNDFSHAIPSVFSERNLDALVIESYSELAHQIYEAVQEARLPMIFLNDRHETNSVYVDDEWGAAELTGYLLGKGYRRICFVHRVVGGGPSVKQMHLSARDREKGYRKTMRKAKQQAFCHTVQTSGVVGLDVELTREDWEIITRHDAVIAYDDDLANLIARTACDHGVRIPSQLAIAGFNGDYSSLCAWQRLTTMRIPSFEMGKRAAEMAFELVKTGSDTALPSSVHRATLMVGQTT